MDIRLNTLSVFMAHELDFSWVKIVTVHLGFLRGSMCVEEMSCERGGLGGYFGGQDLPVGVHECPEGFHRTVPQNE